MVMTRYLARSTNLHLQVWIDFFLSLQPGPELSEIFQMDARISSALLEEDWEGAIALYSQVRLSSQSLSPL